MPRSDDRADVQRAQQVLKKAEALARERSARLHQREVEIGQSAPGAPAAFPRPELPPLPAILDPAEGLALGRRLRQMGQFSYARRILRLTLVPGAPVELAQELSKNTYKDPEVPAAMALDEALDVLRKFARLDDPHAADPETLGQAGAIHKRKWQATGRIEYLKASLDYYLRGHAREQEEQKLDGYNGINAAFVLDLLARAEPPAPGMESRLQGADQLRAELLRRLPRTGSYWGLATRGEALFGLGQFDEANNEYKDARKAYDGAAGEPWMLQTSAQQVAALARARSADGGPRWVDAAHTVLLSLLGSKISADTILRGRVGLALSGGGFRASFFHLGVLARLAELDVLRHVEVLSCVSGGSIVGAAYYLKLKKRLEAQESLSPEDYLTIVRELAERFLTAVQTNIRTSVAADPIATFRLLRDPDYSRSARLGELLEERFYKSDAPSGGLAMTELTVAPKGFQGAFSPWIDNFARDSKVPILVLNATSLNTGHNWQFTARSMGEPPHRIVREIDGNARLRRVYYEDAGPHQRLSLGQAVAASACVPGLFEPLRLSGIYRDQITDEPITVGLVDGGVHDNQGIAALLEHDCSVAVISDGCGQSESKSDPASSALSVLMRSNNLTMASVRAAQYQELLVRRKTGSLAGLGVMHLKQDLQPDPVDWNGCSNPRVEKWEGEGAFTVTSYGIAKCVQEKVAAIRTDLDCFHDAEAYTLMASGYRTATRTMRTEKPFGALAEPAAGRWDFLAVDRFLSNPGRSGEWEAVLDRLLDAGNSQVGKMWKLSRTFKAIALAVAAVAAVALFLLVASLWKWEFRFTLGRLVFAIAATVFSFLLGGRALTRDKLKSVLGITAVAVVAARIDLLLDRWYVSLGRVPSPAAESAKPPAVLAGGSSGASN